MDYVIPHIADPHGIGKQRSGKRSKLLIMTVRRCNVDVTHGLVLLFGIEGETYEPMTWPLAGGFISSTPTAKK